MENYCVCCGREIPEGKMVCSGCETGEGKKYSVKRRFKVFKLEAKPRKAKNKN